MENEYTNGRYMAKGHVLYFNNCKIVEYGSFDAAKKAADRWAKRDEKYNQAVNAS